MTAAIFIDTGAFLARLIPGDQHSKDAFVGWDTVTHSNANLFSSEPILIETSNFLARKAGCLFAAEWMNHCLRSKEIRWLQPDPEDFLSAGKSLKKFSDQRISCTDAISFSLMHRHKIRTVFGYDHHFTMAGFTLWTGSSDEP